MALVAWYSFDNSGVNEPLGMSVAITELAPADFLVFETELEGSPDVHSIIPVGGGLTFTG